MKLTTPTVLPILATPFGVVPLPEAERLNAQVAALLQARAEADPDPVRNANPFCYRSREDLLECSEPAVQALGREMLRGLCSVVAAVNEIPDAELRTFVPQARGWFTIVRPDGAVAGTSYPLTSWCGLYCVAAPEPSATRRDSGALRLYESRLGTMFADATNAAMRIPYTPGHYTWAPVPGQMAVFPAATTHEIALIRSPGELVVVGLRVRFVAPGQQGWTAW